MNGVKNVKGVHIIIAIFVGLVLHARLNVISDAPGYWCFRDLGLIDIPLLYGLYLIVEKIKLLEKRINVSYLILSIVMSILYLVSYSFMSYGSIVFFRAGIFQLFYSCMCLLGYVFLIYICLELFTSWLENATINVNAIDTLNEKRLFWSSVTIILGVWLTYDIVAYPGSIGFDSERQLMQVYGMERLSAHHPPLATFLMGFFVKLGDRIIDVNFGGFLYCLFQTFLGAVVFSYMIKKLMHYGLSTKICYVATCFYAFTPVWGCYAKFVEKDFVYIEIVALCVVIIFDIVITNEFNTKNMLLLFISSILVCLLRKNGVYVIVPTLICMAIQFSSKIRKKIVVIVVTVVSIYLLVDKIVYPVIGFVPGSIAEALSIPFQQTARYVKEYPDELTAEEIEAIGAVLDIDSIADVYTPDVSDRVKGTYKEDSTKLPEYFRVWWKMFLKHPGTYISATYNQNMFYLAPVSAVDIPWFSDEYREGLESLGFKTLFAPKVRYFHQQLRSLNENMPILKYTLMTGAYMWAMVFLLMFVCQRKKYEYIVLFVPEIMQFLICLASPLGAESRYALPILAVMPILIGVSIMSANSRDEKILR